MKCSWHWLPVYIYIHHEIGQVDLGHLENTCRSRSLIIYNPIKAVHRQTHTPNLIGPGPSNLKICNWHWPWWYTSHEIDKVDPCNLERSFIYNPIQALHRRNLHTKFGWASINCSQDILLKPKCGQTDWRTDRQTDAIMTTTDATMMTIPL